jgi:hypothetical protein
MRPLTDKVSASKCRHALYTADVDRQSATVQAGIYYVH